MTWDVPTKDVCPECGKTLFKRPGKGQRKAFCVNEECKKFLPEDKRGYKKKAAASADDEKGKEETAAAEIKEEKPAAKKKKS